MILYFTSTGNCRFVAEKLAAALKDKAAAILDTANIHLTPGEKLGFVFPTYFCRLPSVVDAYMKSLNIKTEDKDPYLYFIATYGTTCGQTGSFMKRHLREKGFALRLSRKVLLAWMIE